MLVPLLVPSLVPLLVALGCASDDGATTSSASSTVADTETTDATEPESTDAPDSETTVEPEPEPGPTGPAPGVTDDAVKIGITFIDQEVLKSIGLDLELGDMAGSYEVLINDINDAGGINGRRLQPVFASIDPTAGGTSADAACVKLTEDEEVFLVTGVLLVEAPLCYLETHGTATLGGTMTQARLDRVAGNAPWFTTATDFEQPIAVIEAFADAGALDGKVGIYGITADSDLITNILEPALADVGVTGVEVGINSAPIDDTLAFEDAIKAIAQNFQANGVDTVVMASASGAGWPTYMQDDPYQPRLLFVDILGAQSFAGDPAARNLATLDGSLSGGGYGPEQAIWEEPDMQECIGKLVDGGHDLVAPDATTSSDDLRWRTAFTACADTALLKALLEAAGPDLNYGTLDAAGDGLTVKLPGDPSPRRYGPPPAADGDPVAYLYTWNPATGGFDLLE